MDTCTDERCRCHVRAICLGCGGNDRVKIERVVFSGRYYHFYWCPVCWEQFAKENYGGDPDAKVETE